MLEAEVARLRKLCDRYKRASVNASSSSIGSTDHLITPDVSSVSGSSEAHRVVKVMKVANEHLQKKIDARDAMLADRLAELEQIHNHHAIELEQQKQGYQVHTQQLIDLHRRELEASTRRNVEQVEAVRRDVGESAATAESHQQHLDRISALQAELDGVRSLEKTRLDSYNATLEEVKLKAAEELAAAKKVWAETEEGWEIKTEEMRRQLLDERRTTDCNCNSELDLSTIDQLKREHGTEIAALKTSIRILEGSRGTTVEQLEEDQRVYRKVTELEASLASKLRALASERKTSERLRSSLVTVEEAKAEIQAQKEAADSKLRAEQELHERLLSEARFGSDTTREEERRAIEEELRQAAERSEKELAEQKEKYEAELETGREKLLQLREQYDTDAQEFDNRITELIKEHIQEKDQTDASHSLAIKNLKQKVKEQRELEISNLKAELEERETSLQLAIQERDANVASSRKAIDQELDQQRLSFEKEKEALIAEYQVVINAGNRLREQDETLFQSRLLEAQNEHQSLKAQSEAILQENLKTAEERFNSKMSQAKAAHQVEIQTLHAAVEEAKAEIGRLRKEYYEEIRRLQDDVTQTKDQAAQVVSELQQQLKDEEENKQQLLDRVAKAEAERDSVETELTGIKARFDGANSALSEQTDALRKAEGQIKMLNEANQTTKSEMESEKRGATQAIAEIRSHMQSREKIAHEFHTKQQREIENLQFQIRTTQTKLEIDGVEIESLKETIREKESALTALRDEKSNSGTLWVDEKRTLVLKHNQLIEGHLSTIAKLEDTANKMRARTTEEAKAAEAKALEQQGLIAQWVSSSNRKGDEVQRLERASKEANSKTESFKLDIKALKNDIKQYEKESKDQKAEIKSLSKELKAAQEETFSLKSQIESSSSSSYRYARQISDLESKIQALAKEINDSRTELSVHKRTRELRDSRADVARLTEKLEMYETEYRHFFEDHEKLKVELEELQRNMRANNDSHVPELEQLRKAKRDLELRLQSAELRLAASGGLVRRGMGDSDGPILRSQSSMSYLRHGEISIGGSDV
ncbi:hypothetical protein ABW20_dc0102064 [Dactylellina cionopaga]|nr:hypothetical protein ABW20_dc0102064 [Dactylellina cionopaga]